MAIQPMALGVQNPQINAVQAMAEGQQAGQQQQMNQINIAKANLAGIAQMAHNTGGDPAKWEQGLDLLETAGLPVQSFRGRADLAPLVAKSAFSAAEQVAIAQDERSYALALRKFEQELAEAAKGPKPTSDMQNFHLSQQDPKFAEFLGKGAQAGARPLTPEERQAWGIPSTDNRPYSITPGKPPEPMAVQGAPEPGGGGFDAEGKLRSEYQGQQGYKDFIQQEQAYQRVLDSAKDASPAGDLALIFNYMKILDPGSVVRESEFATAAASGSFGDRIQSAVEQVTSGKRLSPDQRKDFLQRAGDLFSGASGLYGGMNERYSELAGEYGIEPTRIVRPGAQIGIMSPDFSIDQVLGMPPAPTSTPAPSIADGAIIENDAGERMVLRNGQWEKM